MDCSDHPLVEEEKERRGVNKDGFKEVAQFLPR